jgi:DNA invertase Pin-like site-specific DNA recombinase
MTISDGKIQDEHLGRAAYIYVRQSTLHQVRHNTESQTRQYGLHKLAERYGFRQIVIVDEDLGKSGSGSIDRLGFGRLLTAVCGGGVGAVFSLEASRLARNNRDWHHLLDLCAMTATLVIDENGIYDPRHLNDRLLLGLQGTMSEFELGLFQQRAREALLAMIRRGLAPWSVATGYVRTEELRIEMTPDRQVQEAIRTVFRQFRKLGSAHQVLQWYCDEQLSLPTVVPGSKGREVMWQRPSYNRVIAILKNPAYAGTFVYGRHPTKTVVENGRARKKQHQRQTTIEEWKVVIHDHHPAYITWEDYLEIQRILTANRSAGEGDEQGPAREGSALLGGLLRCSRCGRKLQVSYGGTKGRIPRYCCAAGSLNHGTKPCLSLGGLRLTQAVCRVVLESLRPAGIQAAFQAAEEVSHRDDETRRALELALEKARYEADRLRRQYNAVEPENRLVAAELESRWNVSLNQVTELDSRLRAAVTATQAMTDDERQRLLALGHDLSSVWNHPDASIPLKKRILRCVLHEIIIDVKGEPPEIVLQLHWAGGIHTELRVHKKLPVPHTRCTDREVVDLVRELAKTCDDRSIARILNRLGYRTGPGNAWIGHRVASLRNYHGVPVYERGDSTWCNLRQASHELGISHPSVLKLIEEKILPATQVVTYAPWVIKRKDLERPEVKAAVEAIGQHRNRPRKVVGQQELPFK